MADTKDDKKALVKRAKFDKKSDDSFSGRLSEQFNSAHKMGKKVIAKAISIAVPVIKYGWFPTVRADSVLPARPPACCLFPVRSFACCLLTSVMAGCVCWPVGAGVWSQV